VNRSKVVDHRRVGNLRAKEECEELGKRGRRRDFIPSHVGREPFSHFYAPLQLTYCEEFSSSRSTEVASCPNKNKQAYDCPST
jgi:hypothetical protein